MTRHTPGPWIAGEPDEFGDINIQPADGGLAIAAVVNGEMRRMGGQYGEHIANARLIAAAPKMLAALRLVMENDIADGADPWLVDQIWAAIAKAEGDQA